MFFKMNKSLKIGTLIALLTAAPDQVDAQSTRYWHDKPRKVRYHPEGTDIVILNGERRFNRALYGGNTAFRAEGGDKPEFALYLPGMGGNLKIGIITPSGSKWLTSADSIRAIYRAGSMLYDISDRLLGSGRIGLQAMATFDHEGFILKCETRNIPTGTRLVMAYGGVSGRKFSRDGDVGADPESSFDLKPEYCRNNRIAIGPEGFSIRYDSLRPPLEGVFPSMFRLSVGDADHQLDPVRLLEAKPSAAPLLRAEAALGPSDRFLLYIAPGKTGAPTAADKVSRSRLPKIFAEAERERVRRAGQVVLKTPDPHINALGPALSIAADAVWEHPSFMHGAIAWRMRLNGWRGAYVADVLGWHDRARAHLAGYVRSQVKSPLTAPVVMDTALHLARHLEKLGTGPFSAGYISRNPGGDLRAHHYDMNLVFFDQMFDHFLWTGDTAWLKEMWPVIDLHLAWEKRNFDADGDGLYDAYAAIWASDALQYSGGAVTHSSAYMYRAYRTMEGLARILGKDPHPYRTEADRIKKAADSLLWLPGRGRHAEFRDALGRKLAHEQPGLWTIYHAIDAALADRFQAWQSLEYIDREIPHIPIRAAGLTDTTLYTISITNWQPYTWSLNNVALSELMHTTLAYWQGGRPEAAWHLWKSTLMGSMYLGASPGNLQQLTFYDAIRGELYRDFADGIGMTGRSLTEGLFGIRPDRMSGRVLIRPGFPAAWDSASLKTPDLHYAFLRRGDLDRYDLSGSLFEGVSVECRLRARLDQVASVRVNGRPVTWRIDPDAVGDPQVVIELPPAQTHRLEVRWSGQPIRRPEYADRLTVGEIRPIRLNKLEVTGVRDVHGMITNHAKKDFGYALTLSKAGWKTSFMHLRQGAMRWWAPITVEYVDQKPPVTPSKVRGSLEMVDIARHHNAQVRKVFDQQYLSPRPTVPTLQLPTQGIGNWAYPLVHPVIDDRGLRSASVDGIFHIGDSLRFLHPVDSNAQDIVFTSMWDNYPDSVAIPLQGSASSAHLLMAGTTNPMQSRFLNGLVEMHYTDGTVDRLELRNPENWWPIEQDLYEDGYAFTTDAPRPLRIALATGKSIPRGYRYGSIKGFSNFAVEGGAATVLKMPLDPARTLERLVLHSIANDVVIGLMALTLER
jgi:hypothetical protein